MGGIVYVSMEQSSAGAQAVSSALVRAQSAAAGAPVSDGQSVLDAAPESLPTEAYCSSSRRASPSSAADCWAKMNAALGQSPCSGCRFVHESWHTLPVHVTREGDSGQSEKKFPTESKVGDGEGSSEMATTSPGVVSVLFDGEHNGEQPDVRRRSVQLNAATQAEVSLRLHTQATTAERSVEGSNTPFASEAQRDRLGSASKKPRRCTGCSKQFAVGYTWAAANVLLDVGGSALTKYFGSQMNTWEIGAIRFGSAAFTMLLVR